MTTPATRPGSAIPPDESAAALTATVALGSALEDLARDLADELRRLGVAPPDRWTWDARIHDLARRANEIEDTLFTWLPDDLEEGAESGGAP